MLDKRIVFRLSIVMAGAMLARGRRTAASWFRCAGVKGDWNRFREMLQSIGSNAVSAMLPLLLLLLILKKFDPGEGGHWKTAIDDSPAKRYGPHVETANIHHNPMPGLGAGDWFYEHNWFFLAMLLDHPLFGVIAFPLLSRLHVRQIDIGELQRR